MEAPTHGQVALGAGLQAHQAVQQAQRLRAGGVRGWGARRGEAAQWAVQRAAGPGCGPGTPSAMRRLWQQGKDEG